MKLLCERNERGNPASCESTSPPFSWHKKQQYFVYPVCSPNRIAITMKLRQQFSLHNAKRIVNSGLGTKQQNDQFHDRLMQPHQQIHGNFSYAEHGKLVWRSTFITRTLHWYWNRSFLLFYTWARKSHFPRGYQRKGFSSSYFVKKFLTNFFAA